MDKKSFLLNLINIKPDQINKIIKEKGKAPKPIIPIRFIKQ